MSLLGTCSLPTPPPLNRTLGPVAEEWMIEHLVDGFTGEPLELTNEQRDFLDVWYAVDENGRFTYRQGVLCRVRGAGKSPLGAYIACLELAGPSRFHSYDDEDGLPMAVRALNPWIQVIATALHQTRAIMEIAGNCWSEDAKAKYGIDIGKERIYATGTKGKLEAVSNSPRALRGPRPTLCLMEETSEWVQTNGGHDAVVRINGNLRKSPNGTSRSLQLCNAWILGEDSVAERTHSVWTEEQDRGMTSTLFDWRQPSFEVDLADEDSLRAGLTEANGDATWLDIETAVSAALDRNTSPATFRREHLAQLVTEDDAIVDLQLYDALATADLIQPGDAVTLGFDGSLSDDGTALVAFRVCDRSFHLLGYSEPDPLVEDWRVDQEYFVDLVDHAWSTYDVRGFCSDVFPWADHVMAWERQYGQRVSVTPGAKSPIALDMRGNRELLTHSFMNLRMEMETRKVSFCASGRMRHHFANARIKPNRFGETFGKAHKNSQRRVDVVSACLLAYIVGVKVDKKAKTRRTSSALTAAGGKR